MRSLALTLLSITGLTQASEGTDTQTQVYFGDTPLTTYSFRCFFEQ